MSSWMVDRTLISMQAKHIINSLEFLNEENFPCNVNVCISVISRDENLVKLEIYFAEMNYKSIESQKAYEVSWTYTF